MVKIPKQTYAQLGLGESSHSSRSSLTVKKWMPFGFQVSQHHRERQGVFFAGQDPRTSITFDQALAACVAKVKVAPHDTDGERFANQLVREQRIHSDWKQ